LCVCILPCVCLWFELTKQIDDTIVVTGEQSDKVSEEKHESIDKT